MVIAVLLSDSAKAIGCRPDILHIDIAFIVQVTQQLRKGIKRLSDVLCFFSLGVGFVGDFDVEVEAAFAMLRQRLARNNPVLRVDVLNGYRGDIRILVQNSAGEFQKNCRDPLSHVL